MNTTLSHTPRQGLIARIGATVVRAADDVEDRLALLLADPAAATAKGRNHA